MEYIANPIPENTDFLHAANDKNVRRTIFNEPMLHPQKVLATKFTDLALLKNIQHSLQDTNRLRVKISTIAAYIRGFPLQIALSALVYILAIHLVAVTTDSIVFTIASVITITPLALFAVGEAIYASEDTYRKQTHRDISARLNKTPKTRLANISVVCIDQFETAPQSDLYKVGKAAGDVIRWKKEYQDYRIDTSRFEQAYDEYMETFIFAYANKNAMSESLFQKYDVELDVLGRIVAEEAKILWGIVREIDQTIELETKKANVFKESLEAQRQEETDIAITTLMPLRHYQETDPRYL